MMEIGDQQDRRTNHDRNGVNGSKAAAEDWLDKAGKEGDNGHDFRQQVSDGTAHSRMNDLPDSIVHITHGFVPLSLLLSRLAQVSHNSLQDKIAELAKMALPAAAVNGGSASPSADDVSSDNLRKKSALATFAQDMHAKWLKALVITEWSRQAPQVSKLIDLKFHIDQQRMVYDAALDHMANIKRDLTYARMPSPDLKTSLQVLSAGRAPWMPDLNYIEPPALTPEAQLRWINDLDTLLALRLNLDDFDKMPHEFRHYEISSGRVTFKVQGEFELDLTIAHEDFDKQFWFIDFRYDFSPAASSLPPSLLAYLEAHVNQILAKDGLTACYHFLHEFVLTCKINELKRQAIELSTSSWNGTLMVEALNRALAIQYWTTRSAITGAKHWILIAVTSGRKADGTADAKRPSGLTAKWYRDSQHVEHEAIRLDVKELSAESLLGHVIGRHVEFIFKSIQDKLMAAGCQQSETPRVAVKTSLSDAASSRLVLQDGVADKVTLLVEPMTGACSLKPCSRLVVPLEKQLNSGKLTAEEGAACLENARCAIAEEELMRRAGVMGWLARKPALSVDETRLVTKRGNWTRAVWFGNSGWDSKWVIAAFLGLGGDEWWLLQVGEAGGGPTRSREGKIKFKTQLPLGNMDRRDQFWTRIGTLVTSIMAQCVDVAELQQHGVKSCPGEGGDGSLGRLVRLPSITIALSALFPGMVSGKHGQRPPMEGKIKSLALMQSLTGTGVSNRKAWAEEAVTIKYRSVQIVCKQGLSSGRVSFDEQMTLTDTVIKLDKPARLRGLAALCDGDIAYRPQSGKFVIGMKRRLGEPMLQHIKLRIRVIDRFVNYVRALDKAKGSIDGESARIGRVRFRYGDLGGGDDGHDDGGRHGKSSSGSSSSSSSKHQKEGGGPRRRPWCVMLDLSGDKIKVVVQRGSPHLAVEELLNMVVNRDDGIDALLSWLPESIPLFRAMEAIKTRWRGSTAGGQQVSLGFMMKTVAWMSLRYSVGGQRQVTFEVQLKAEGSRVWWQMMRSDAGARSMPRDDVGRALQGVWDGSGHDWQGFGSSATGTPGHGVGNMLMAVDDAVGRAIGRHAGRPEGHYGAEDHGNVVVLD